MDEPRGIQIIKSLQKNWSRRILLACFLSACALTIAGSAIAVLSFHAGWLYIPLCFIFSVAVVLLVFYQKIRENDVVNYLDATIPEMQESSGLLLKSYTHLNTLEKLQVPLIEHALLSDINPPKKIQRRLQLSGIAVLLASLLAFVLVISNAGPGWQPAGTVITGIQRKKEVTLPEIRSAVLLLTPPAYTGKSTRQQETFNLVVEEGGSIAWKIITTQPVKNVRLLFNDKSILVLRPSDKDSTIWLAGKQVRSPGFYQVQIAGKLSELYRMEVIRDQLPVVSVQTPKPNTLIEPGQAQRSLLNVVVSDDYGIGSVYISATVASGEAEGVRFKQQQMAFPAFASGRKEYRLQKQFDLRSMGMKPGDELYFFITATDTHNQEKRSDIFIIRLGDTTKLMSLEGLANGTDIKPDFFRSQRQIIIETEQLLKNADTMATANFRNRSNELGIDQKLLRLRYGKFLGEETDAEIGGDHDHSADASDFGNGRKMLDEIAHKHDNAEDAGFFDVQTKQQLKVTLAEMWKAELQLRTIRPKDALPFEYKALRLLKELQQQSRVYVGKTGSKTTPLSPEKRLTGERDKIIQPSLQQNFAPAAEGIMLRRALGILEQLRNRETVTQANAMLFRQAATQLSLKAAADPAAFLSSYEAMNRILQNNFSQRDISLAGNGLQRMIKPISQLPQQFTISPDQQLSQRYFMNLTHANE